MPRLDDVSRIAAGLPGSEQREVFRASGISWGGPKVLFRLGLIDPQLLVEAVTEAWHTQAPRYLRKEFDDDKGASDS